MDLRRPVLPVRPVYALHVPVRHPPRPWIGAYGRGGGWRWCAWARRGGWRWCTSGRHGDCWWCAWARRRGWRWCACGRDGSRRWWRARVLVAARQLENARTAQRREAYRGIVRDEYELIVGDVEGAHNLCFPLCVTHWSGDGHKHLPYCSAERPPTKKGERTSPASNCGLKSVLNRVRSGSNDGSECTRSD